MRKGLTIMGLTAALIGGAYAHAQEAPKLVEVGNKLCPVSGEQIGTMGEGLPVEHNGKMYKLCCEGCLKDFNKDPEKFTKIAEDEAAQAAETTK